MWRHIALSPDADGKNLLYSSSIQIFNSIRYSPLRWKLLHLLFTYWWKNNFYFLFGLPTHFKKEKWISLLSDGSQHFQIQFEFRAIFYFRDDRRHICRYSSVSNGHGILYKSTIYLASQRHKAAHCGAWERERERVSRPFAELCNISDRVK